MNNQTDTITCQMPLAGLETFGAFDARASGLNRENGRPRYMNAFWNLFVGIAVFCCFRCLGADQSVEDAVAEAWIHISHCDRR